MTYCLAADVIAAAGAHLGNSVLADVLGVAVGELPGHPDIAKAVLSASRRIDGYLSVRYPVPLPIDAPSLRVVAEDIALYYLMRLRRYGDMQHLQTRYDEQIKWLEAVRDAKGNVPEMHSSAYAESAISTVDTAAGDGAGGGIHMIAPVSRLVWGGY